MLAGILATTLFFGRCVARSSVSSLLFWGALAIFACSIVVESSHPITSRDALIHHLAVPRWWVEAGRIIRIPWHEWSHYPMLVNLGFTGLLSQGLDHATPLYHALYLLLLCGVVASFVLYKTQDHTAAAIAFILMFTIPVCLRLAASPLVDLGLALYSTLALVHLIYWAEGKHLTLHLLVSGLALGLALSCKYNGILFCGVLGIALFLFAFQSSLSMRGFIKASLFSGLCALVVYAPWLFKNIAWTNNPLYPLFNSYFSVSPGPASSGSGLSPLEQRMLLYGESVWDILAIPIRMLVLGEDGNPRRFDGVLSPILLLGFIPLYRFRKEPWVIFTWLCVLLYISIALLMSSARVRYLAPVFGPLVILTAVGGWHLMGILRNESRRVGYVVLLAVALMWSAWHAGLMLAQSHAVEYLSAAQTPRQYLRSEMSEYSAIEFINMNVPDTSTVYLLNTGNRFYYFNKKVISSGHFSASQILAWIRSSTSAEFLLREFQHRGIDYLMTNTRLTLTSFREMLSAEEAQIWNDFYGQHLTPVFDQNGFSVWKVQ